MRLPYRWAIRSYNGSTTSTTSAPHRLCGPGNLKVLSLENIFQPIEGQVIGELAGYDECQKPRASKTFLDRRVCFGGYFDLRIFSLALTMAARILLAYMLEAFEVSRNVLDLQLLSLLISLRSTPQLGQGRCSALNSYTYVLTGRFSKLARARRPWRRFTCVWRIVTRADFTCFTRVS